MKNKHAILETFLYPAALGLGFFIRALPLRMSLLIARMFGSAAYRFYGKRRSIGYVNIKAALAGRLSPAEIKSINKRIFQHFTEVLFELFRFPDIDKRYADRYVSTEGLQRIDEVLKNGRGAVILTAHFGNWELSGLVGAIKGYPQDVLARQQKYPRLNKLLNSYRERYGRRVIEKGIATREIIASLKANKVVAILSDQDGGMQGCLVNFFGRLASTPKGAAALALKYDSAIMPNFCARQKGPFYRMTVERPLELEKTADIQKDIRSALQKFTGLLESYITRYPDQWLWLHKRWKTTPSRRVLILTDGKAGHLNQSRAAAKQIKNAVLQKAQADERVTALKDMPGLEGLIYQEKTVEVSYKSPLHRCILAVLSLFASRSCQGCMRCVRLCLTPASYKNLMSAHADVVVSCGSSLAAVNRFLCRENACRSIVVNKPGILPLSRFNLCIIPRHDNPGRLKNVLVTEGALNLVEGAPLRGQAKVKGQGSRVSIGLLLGGDTKDFTMTYDAVGKVIDGVVGFAAEKNADILVTTSRRTPKYIDELVKSRLSAAKNCRQLVIANEKNVAGAVRDILAASGIVIVSGESVSMVSEAAGSGKKVVVFEPQPRKANSRHFRFLENLRDRGFITLCKVEEIFDAVKAASQDKTLQKTLNDNASVFEAVKKIV